MIDDASQMVLEVARAEPRLTRDTFFEGACNSAALTEVLTTDFWDGQPRVLSGPAGAGKTHLAHIFAAETGALVLTPSRLAADSVPRAADAPAVVLDNAQTLSRGRIFEEIAFHMFNQARDMQQPLLIAGRGPVRDWGLRLPDLSSRLTATAQIQISNPDEDALRMVLIKLFADRQLAVPAEAIEYTVHRMERSFHAARALVAALDDANLRENRRITKPMIRETIARLSQGKTLQGGPE